MNSQSAEASVRATYHPLRSALWILTLVLVASFPASALTLSSDEQAFASLMINSSGQRRDRSLMEPDDRLIQVARARAMDMAKNNYFDHVNKSGVAANYLVRATGYVLPASYSTSRTANNIESIGAGYTSASEAWNALSNHTGHKEHLLATDSFYRAQTSYGVGHYYDPNSKYRHYWVIITAPPSPVATLSIATPTAGAKVTAPSLSVTGNVSGTAVFSSLQYRLETQAGLGDWNQLPLPSGNTVGKWAANVGGLRPGVNTVRVRTLTTSGAVARETTRSVRLIMVKPLIVAVDGPGTVTPGLLGTTQHEVGVTVVINALPQPGQILSQWDGLPAGLDPFRPNQSFPMQENISLTAHFIPDPYPALAAGYAGVFTDTGPAHETTGALFTKLTTGGAFTGALFFSGQRLVIKGSFNSQGDAEVTIPRVGKTALVVSLHIDTTGADQQITGSLTDGTATLALAAARGPATTTPGQYNVHISPAADPAVPHGNGYAMLIVGAAGQVRITGMLADGTPITAASYVTASAIPLYAPLFGGTGSLAGTITLNSANAQGTLDWHKPARPNTRFQAAFDTQNAAAGSLYTPPTGTDPALALASASLEVDSLDLPAILTLPFNIGPSTRITYPAVPPVGWRLAINPRNGFFVGTYAHPGSRVRPFRGLVDQAAAAGYGFSLGPTQSASVTIAP